MQAVRAPVTQPLRPVAPARVFTWLAAGWRDFQAVPGVSAAHGLIFALGALFIISIGWRDSGLLAGAFSGFVLVAPVLVTGFHEMSRRMQSGDVASRGALLDVWRRRRARLLGFGLLLAFIGSVWVGFSTLLVRIAHGAGQRGVSGFVRDFVVAGDTGLFLVWCLAGGLLAAIVFAISVVSVPMLVDRDVSLSEAIHASIGAVGASPGAAATWAAVIMVLTLLGLLTVVGLVIVVPVLGHAAWHAYRDLS